MNSVFRLNWLVLHPNPGFAIRNCRVGPARFERRPTAKQCRELMVGRRGEAPLVPPYKLPSLKNWHALPRSRIRDRAPHGQRESRIVFRQDASQIEQDIVLLDAAEDAD